MHTTKEIMENGQDVKPVNEREPFGIEQFAMGLNAELEPGRRDPETDITHDEPIASGKIAPAHLNEISDYYTRLAVMGNEAERMKSRLRRDGIMAPER